MHSRASRGTDGAFWLFDGARTPQRIALDVSVLLRGSVSLLLYCHPRGAARFAPALAVPESISAMSAGVDAPGHSLGGTGPRRPTREQLLAVIMQRLEQARFRGVGNADLARRMEARSAARQGLAGPPQGRGPAGAAQGGAAPAGAGPSAPPEGKP